MIAQLSDRRVLALGGGGEGYGIRVAFCTYMTRLRVLSGDTPRLNLEVEGGSSTFSPLWVDVEGWGSWCGKETTLFAPLPPPPGPNREPLLLVCDFGERFGLEE
jgi:hypothetical protein